MCAEILTKSISGDRNATFYEINEVACVWKYAHDLT